MISSLARRLGEEAASMGQIKEAISARLASRALEFGLNRGLPEARLQRYVGRLNSWLPGAVTRAHDETMTQVRRFGRTPGWSEMFDSSIGAGPMMSRQSVDRLHSAMGGARPHVVVAAGSPRSWPPPAALVTGAGLPLTGLHEAGHAATAPALASLFATSQRPGRRMPALMTTSDDPTGLTRRGKALNEYLANRQVRNRLPEAQTLVGPLLTPQWWSRFTRPQMDSYRLQALQEAVRDFGAEIPSRAVRPYYRGGPMPGVSYPPFVRRLLGAARAPGS